MTRAQFAIHIGEKLDECMQVWKAKELATLRELGIHFDESEFLASREETYRAWKKNATTIAMQCFLEATYAEGSKDLQ